MDELVENFEKSLFDNSKDIIGDYLEIGIDSIIDEGILKEIPIVKTIVGVLKVGKNVHDRNLLKQTLVFINEFNRKEIRQDKIEEYKKRIENNPKKCEDELGRIILLLNNFIDKEKSIMLAKLFKAYIKQQINWDSFCEFSEIINRIFIQDLHILCKIKNRDIDLMFSREDEFRAERLYSIGLIGMSFKALTYQNIKNGQINNRRTISPLGKQFCEIVL